jgi:hypothetical protein
MKQSFLDRLRGVDTTQAELRVKGKGYEAYVVPSECAAITMILRPNTVILWQQDRDGIVSLAQAGNPDELESNA